MSAYLGGGPAPAGEQAPRGRCVGHDRQLRVPGPSSWRGGSSTRSRTSTCSTTRSAGSVSRIDPELHALALMPLAMSIEILAEAASCLLPDRVVTGLRDLRAHRWLAFEEDPADARRSAPARLAGEGGLERVRVELRNLDEDGAAGDPRRRGDGAARR